MIFTTQKLKEEKIIIFLLKKTFCLFLKKDFIYMHLLFEVKNIFKFNFLFFVLLFDFDEKSDDLKSKKKKRK
jgi:hypothetical protein